MYVCNILEFCIYVVYVNLKWWNLWFFIGELYDKKNNYYVFYV